MSVHPALEAVARYRQTAQRIAASSAPMTGPSGKCLAITRLGLLAHAEPDPVVRAWATEGIWRDVRDLLGWMPSLDAEPRLHHDERVRLMIRANYRDCPVCGERLRPGASRERAS